MTGHFRSIFGMVVPIFGTYVPILWHTLVLLSTGVVPAAAAATADRSTGDEPVAEPEKRQTSDSGQELDRRSDAASAEGESDADEEDNADTAW